MTFSTGTWQIRAWGESPGCEQRPGPLVRNGQVACLLAGLEGKTLLGVYLPGVVGDAGLLGHGGRRQRGAGNLAAPVEQAALVLPGAAQAQVRVFPRNFQQDEGHPPRRVEVFHKADQPKGCLVLSTYPTATIVVGGGKACLPACLVAFPKVLHSAYPYL